MLKLKDNVPMEELEKYGFEYHDHKAYDLSDCCIGLYGKNHWSHSEKYMSSFITSKITYGFLQNDRKLIISVDLPCPHLDFLYDMITAGLVEKVEEK